MARKGRKKSAQLSDGQRQEVADWAVNHPEESDREVGLRFGCTPNQVRYARQLADAGEIIVRRDRASRQLRIAEAMSEADVEEILARQITRLLAQLDADDDMPAKDRAWCLNQVTRIQQRLEDMRLDNVLKSANTGIVRELVRLYEPEASEKRIVEQYQRAEQRWHDLR